VKKIFQGTQRNIYLLGIVSFLNDLGSEMIMPILPMFITALGGTGLTVGIVGGVRDSVSSILKILCGYWSDKSGKRKVFVVWGYGVSALFKFVLAFSRSAAGLIFFSGLERVGKGMRTAPRDAIIAESMPQERGKGFGIHRTFDTLGAIAGSVLVLVLFWVAGASFRTVIVIAGLLSCFSLIPLFFVRAPVSAPKDISLHFGLKNLPVKVKILIGIAAAFSMADISYMFFILRAQQFFPGKLSVGGPILLYILFNIFSAISAAPFGVLSDRIGRHTVLLLGYSLFTIATAGFIVASSVAAFIVLFALYGISSAIVDSNQRAFVSDAAQEGYRATALGTFHMCVSLITLPANLIAGFLWQKAGSTSTFAYAACAGALTFCFFLFYSRKR
jgi:MFS family permease